MAKVFTNIPAGPFMSKKWSRSKEIVQVLFETQLGQDGNIIIQNTNDFYESVGQYHSIKEWRTIRPEKAMSHLTTALNNYENAIEAVSGEVNHLAEEIYKNDFKYQRLIDPQESTQAPEKVVHTPKIFSESYEERDTSNLDINPNYANPFPGKEPGTLKIVRYTTTALNRIAFDQMQHLCRNLKYRTIRPLDVNNIPENKQPIEENLLGLTSKVSSWLYTLFMVLGMVAETTLYHFLMRNVIGMGETESILASLGALAVFSCCGFGLYKYVRPYLVSKNKTPKLFFVAIVLAALMVLGMGLLNQTNINLEKLEDDLVLLQTDKQNLNEELFLDAQNTDTRNSITEVNTEIQEKKAEIKVKKARMDWISFITLGITGLTIFLSVCLMKAALILMKRASHYRSKRDKAKKRYMELRKTHAAIVKQHDRARDLLNIIVFHICRRHAIESNLAMKAKTIEYQQAVQESIHNGHSHHSTPISNPLKSNLYENAN